MIEGTLVPFDIRSSWWLRPNRWFSACPQPPISHNALRANMTAFSRELRRGCAYYLQQAHDSILHGNASYTGKW
jgi:hypothetical protein